MPAKSLMIISGALRLAREPEAETPEPRKAKEALAERRVRAREATSPEEAPAAALRRPSDARSR